jgi:hypothetical protein
MYRKIKNVTNREECHNDVKNVSLEKVSHSEENVTQETSHCK